MEDEWNVWKENHVLPMTNNMTESNNYNRLVDKKWFVCPLPKEDAFDVWSAFKC